MIRVVCVGKIKEKYLNNLINDYKNRISKYHKIEIHEIIDTDKEKESLMISKVLKSDDYNICLDVLGDKINSIELSNLISDVFVQSYKNIVFVIGGSNGVDDSVKKICNKCISFSDLTFPHGLFRGVLLEQIYRSLKIINNEAYHK